ncbi:MAG: Gldg family protein [Treponema sp.]|nr:Gldg family protein [Treponema sp.]
MKIKNYLKYNLENSLRSPVFYILSVLFSLFIFINYFIRQQFFSGNGSTDLILFFSAVPYICIIAIPSLCYRQSFSIYDDFIPLSGLERQFAVFLSQQTLFSIQLILLLPAVLLVNLFGTTDCGQIFTSFICLFFYGAAVIALCGFIQNLILNKVSSLILSALVLAVFNSAHLFAVYVQLPDFLASFFKTLSFAWHFDAAGKGIFDSRDIIWLLGSAALFIFLSDSVNQLKKGRKFTKNQKLSRILLPLIAFLIMLNGNRWYTRIDFSANKTYSISKYTKSLISRIESPVKITYYRSSSIAKLYPQIRDVADFLNDYASQSKNISLIIKDPDKDSAVRTMLENYGIASQQLRTVSGNSTEYLTVYSAIVIEQNGNAETIPFTMAANTLEYDLDGRLRHLMSGTSRTVNIIIGNGMSLNEDYSYVIPWLSSQGFICNALYVEDPAFESALSASSGPLLVIGDSEVKIDAAIAIESYILSGKGNAFFAVSPYVCDIENNWYLTQAKRTNLVELCEHWGAVFLPKIAADVSCSRITMYADDNSSTQLMNYPLWISLLQQQNSPLGMILFWANPLELTSREDEKGQTLPYLLTSSASYSYEIDKASPEKLIETNPFVLQNMSTKDINYSQQIVAAEVTGAIDGLYNIGHLNNSHIIIIPDQYFLSSLMNGYIGGENGDYRNFEFLTNALLKLNGEEELAALQSRTNRDSSLYKVSDVVQFNTLRLITFIILFVILPLLVNAFGVVINVKK